jgi:hypothetical protein
MLAMSAAGRSVRDVGLELPEMKVSSSAAHSLADTVGGSVAGSAGGSCSSVACAASRSSVPRASELASLSHSRSGSAGTDGGLFLERRHIQKPVPPNRAAQSWRAARGRVRRKHWQSQPRQQHSRRTQQALTHRGHPRCRPRQRRRARTRTMWTLALAAMQAVRTSGSGPGYRKYADLQKTAG